jgi:hypothetical protein
MSALAGDYLEAAQHLERAGEYLRAGRFYEIAAERLL